MSHDRRLTRFPDGPDRAQGFVAARGAVSYEEKTIAVDDFAVRRMAQHDGDRDGRGRADRR